MSLSGLELLIIQAGTRQYRVDVLTEVEVASTLRNSYLLDKLDCAAWLSLLLPIRSLLALPMLCPARLPLHERLGYTCLSHAAVSQKASIANQASGCNSSPNSERLLNKRDHEQTSKCDGTRACPNLLSQNGTASLRVLRGPQNNLL